MEAPAFIDGARHAARPRSTPDRRPHTPSVRARSLAVLTPLLLLACAAEDRGPAALPSDAPVEIDPVPLVTVGVVAGDPVQEFDGVVAPFLLPDGRLAVPLRGASTIRVFGADGRYESSLGQAGEGPGEFRNLLGAWPRGDTIEALDARLRRVTRFFPDGDVDVVSLRSATLGDVSAIAGPIPGGWVAGGVADVDPDGRDEMAVHRFGLDGGDLGPIARVPGMMRFSTGEVGGPAPLSPRAIFAVRGGSLYFGETLTTTVRVHDPRTVDERVIAWSPPPRASPRAAIDLVADSLAARGSDRPMDRLNAVLVEEAPVPDQLSTFWGLVVDERGFLWVRPYEPAVHAAALGGPGSTDAGGRWTVLMPEGGVAGSVDVPADLEPTWITENAVVGIARDAMGVESVRVHRLVRSP